MQNFGFWGQATLNVESCPVLQHILQMPSSGCTDQSFLAALCRAYNGWQVGCAAADWWDGKAGCYPKKEEHVVEEKIHSFIHRCL